MGKILNLPHTRTKEEWLQEAIEAIQKGEKISVAVENADGTIMTGYWNCDCADKQVMVSHMQIDIITQVMNANYILEETE